MCEILFCLIEPDGSLSDTNQDKNDNQVADNSQMLIVQTIFAIIYNDNSFRICLM